VSGERLLGSRSKRVKVKLTKAVIAAAELRQKEYFIWDEEVTNLAVRVSKSGRKTFVYQYRFNKRSARLTIGPALVLPVTYARDLRERRP
jgi:hypothetical protein